MPPAPPKAPSSVSVEALARVTRDPLVLDERADAPALVRALPAQSFVDVVRRLDAEGRLDLVLPHATHEQLVALLDLDAWRRDRVVIPRARRWLAEIARHRAGGELARGRLVRTVYGMDPEMWSLALHAGLVVEELDPEDDERRFRALDALRDHLVYETPDGLFVVGAPKNPDGERAVATLQAVYDDSLRDGARLVRSIEALLPSVAEEDLLRWRQGRLCDLGFVPWEDAMTLLRPLAPERVWAMPATERAVPDPDAVDDAALVRPAGEGRLRAVFERLEAGEHGVRAREFLYLVHHLIAAQRFEPGDPILQRLALDQTRATIELGFELALAAADDLDDPEAALAERVAAVGLRPFFQVGYGPLDRLRRAAVALHRGGRVSLTHPGSLLDRPLGASLAAALGHVPMLPAQDQKRLPRPIGSRPDLAVATRRLAQAALLVRLTFDPNGYGIDGVWLSRVDEPERLRLGDLVRTALALELLDGPGAAFRPLGPQDLARLAERFDAETGRLPGAREAVAARLRRLGAGPEAAELAAPLVTRLEGELAALERDDAGVPDVARVGGLLSVQRVGLWLATTQGPPRSEGAQGS